MFVSDAGQVTSSAAELYDEFFVPALFADWAPRVVDAAGIGEGMRVLDVACGTGVLALAAAEVAGDTGAVAGLDLNPGMLAVAQRKRSDIQWHEGPAEALPFESQSFDVVVSQFGLMFFADQRRSLEEMWRVLRPAGRLAVAVWGSLDEAPGYAAATSLLSRLFGDAVADLLRSPYSLGNPEELRSLLVAAGIPEARVQLEPGVARFPSIRAWMECDVRGWTLGAELDDRQFEHLASEAEDGLSRFLTEDGSVEFAHPALIATAAKPV